VIPVSGMRVYVATRPVDFRKGPDGLAAVAQETPGLDPFCGAIFVFRSKRADRVKAPAWDGTGLVLAHRRLEGAKFAWPKVADGMMRLAPAQVSALFGGLAWRGPGDDRGRSRRDDRDRATHPPRGGASGAQRCAFLGA
jgi:transposase